MILVKTCGSVGGSDLDPLRVIWVWIQVDPDFWV